MDNYIKERLLEYGEVLEDPSFKQLTTIRIGGKAMALFYPHSILSLQAMIDFCNQEKIAWVVLGNGSNLLASDDYYPGIIIKLTRHISDVYRTNDYSFEVQAGASLIALAHQARKHGLSGLEWAAGIPGSVGGATYMNAGAYKHSIADIIDEVCVLKDSSIVWMDVSQCEFSYRQSIFKHQPNWTILAIRITLSPGDKEEIEALMQQRQARRISSQPLESPSFGSTFRNPQEQFAWQLIESCNFRGYQIGGAQVSTKHTNFLINSGTAAFEDMLNLIHKIQQEVMKTYEIPLELEVEIFNWPK